MIPANVTVTKKDGTAVTVVASGATAGQLNLTKKDNGFELSNLEDNVEYNVSVKNFADLSGNLTNPNVVNFTVKSTAESDKVAPKVTDVTANGLNKVVVSIDKQPLDISTTPGTTLAKYVTLTGVTEKTAAAQVYDKKAGTVTVELDSTLPSNGDIKSIKVDGFKNLDGVAGTAFTKLVVFSTTTKVVKSEVVAVPTAGNAAITEDHIKVTFDKDIAFTTPSGVVTADLLTKDNLATTVSIPAANFTKGAAIDNEENILYIKLEGVTDLEEGKLTVPVAKAVVTTLAANDEITVDYKPLSSNKSNPEIDLTLDTNGVKVTKNKVEVKYTQDMGQSALDLNNYTVGGQKVFEKAVFKGNKKLVELTVKPNTIANTATYDFKIAKAVANDKGIALKKDYITTEVFNKSVQPEITKAVLNAANEITITFNEDVAVTEDAFDVFVDGVKVPATITAITSETDTAVVTITTALTADQITKPITVKLAKDAVVKDANDNVLKAFDFVTVQ